MYNNEYVVGIEHQVLQANNGVVNAITSYESISGPENDFDAIEYFRNTLNKKSTNIYGVTNVSIVVGVYKKIF